MKEIILKIRKPLMLVGVMVLPFILAGCAPGILVVTSPSPVSYSYEIRENGSQAFWYYGGTPNGTQVLKGGDSFTAENKTGKTVSGVVSTTVYKKGGGTTTTEENISVAPGGTVYSKTCKYAFDAHFVDISGYLDSFSLSCGDMSQSSQ